MTAAKRGLRRGRAKVGELRMHTTAARIGISWLRSPAEGSLSAYRLFAEARRYATTYPKRQPAGRPLRPQGRALDAGRFLNVAVRDSPRRPPDSPHRARRRGRRAPSPRAAGGDAVYHSSCVAKVACGGTHASADRASASAPIGRFEIVQRVQRAEGDQHDRREDEGDRRPAALGERSDAGANAISSQGIHSAA